MRKIIILTSVLFISVLAAAVLYFSQLSGKAQNNSKILARIPAKTAFIFQFRNDGLTADLFKNYQLFNTATGEQGAAEIRELRELLLKQPEMAEFVDGQDIFFSLFPVEKDSTDILWTITLGKNADPEDLSAALLLPSDDFESSKITIAKSAVLGIKLKSLNKVFYVYLEKGMAAGSFSKKLLADFLDPAVPKISKNLIAEINASGLKNTNSPFNFFINNSALFDYSANFLNKKPDGNFLLVSNLTGMTALNMNFKNDAFMFNGIAQADTAAQNYINLFLSQSPVLNTIKRTFPVNTANFTAFGVSGYPSFQTGLKSLLQKRGELGRLSSQIARLKNKYSINIERDIPVLLGNEFAVLQTASGEKLSVIGLKDGRQMGFLLEEMSSPVSETIRRFNDSNLLYYYLGDPLKPYSRPFFMIVDNYLIVANDAASLGHFSAYYADEKLLYKTPEFIEFNQFTANQSNIAFFIHTKNSSRIIKNTLRPAYAGLFDEKNGRFKDFYGLAYQWSADKDHFFINFFASHQAPEADQLSLVWKTALNSRLAIAPQLISGNDNEKIILVQDNVNNLYLLSAEGEKLLSTQLPGKILGNVIQLDDKSLLFNTSEQLFHINLRGTPAINFPVRLQENASYGLSITDTEPSKLKIFIPCGDKIAGYDATGKALSGWNKQLDGKILFDLKAASAGNTDFIIAGTVKGTFYFFNQAGNLAAKAEEKGTFSNPLSLEIAASEKESRILTTDTAGTLKTIYFDGRITSGTPGVWSGDHFFRALNISGDQRPELIYVDKNQLFVYGEDTSLTFNYDFGINTVARPQFFPVSQSVYRIGLAANQGNLLYLFDDDGNLAKGFPVKGLPAFYIGNIHNNGLRYLICGGTDNYLYVYKL